jgi:hypothetical protein
MINLDTNNASSNSWRVWVRDHTAAAAIVAGLVATQMATVVGYWLPGVGLPQLDWNRVNGAIFTPTASPNVQFISGGVFHYLDGIVFSVIFAVGVYPLLRWGTTVLGNLAKALTFGTVLALISVLFMIPRVYFPAAHPGFFRIHLGWKLILGVFVWHWIYGLHLGLIFNPARERGEDPNVGPRAAGSGQSAHRSVPEEAASM